MRWNQRFDPAGHLQFVEIYFDDELEQVCVVDNPGPSQSQVQVHGYDPFWLTKKAYERDWIVVQAPRDVIERGTQLWVPALADNFPPGALNPQWTPSTSDGGTVTVGPSGGVTLAVPGGGPPFPTAQIASDAVTVPATQVWSATAAVQYQNLNGSFFTFTVTESDGNAYQSGGCCGRRAARSALWWPPAESARRPLADADCASPERWAYAWAALQFRPASGRASSSSRRAASPSSSSPRISAWATFADGHRWAFSSWHK